MIHPLCSPIDLTTRFGNSASKARRMINDKSSSTYISLAIGTVVETTALVRITGLGRLFGGSLGAYPGWWKDIGPLTALFLGPTTYCLWPVQTIFDSAQWRHG